MTYQLSLGNGKIKKASVPASIPHRILSCLGFICHDYDLIVRGDPAFAQGATSGFQRGRGLICRSNGASDRAKSSGGQWYSGSSRKRCRSAHGLSSRGRWYCMWNNGKVKAFTLLEALVALLVLSGGVLVFQGLTKLLHAELDYQAHQKQGRMGTFQQQLQVELDRSF